MKKILGILIILVVFFAFVILVVAPQQGGLVSSTEYRISDLEAANPEYNESLPIQTVGMGSSGRSIFIAIVMLSHVLYANLHLGGAWIAAGTESAYLLGKRPRFKRLARSLTLFNVIIFSAGATFAIAGVLFFISLFPAFSAQAFHIYWWPLLAEAITFAFEIFLLYSYWFTWDRISPGWHQFLGYAYAVSVFIQTFLINMLAAGMLTPGQPGISWGSTGLFTMPVQDLLAWWFNPTLWILQFHRLFAAISYFGFLLGLIAMFHYLDRKDDPSKQYWDMVGSYGLTWGLLGLVVQPVLGLTYMRTIFLSQPTPFRMIMLGPRAWEMVVMVGLFSLLVISAIVYMMDRRERLLARHENRVLKKIFPVFLVVAAVSGFILIQPAYLAAGLNPLGYMSYKLVALFLLVVIGALMLGIDAMVLGKNREDEWGNLSRTSRWALMVAGVLGMWIVVVMGYVRESARAPFIVSDIIPVPGGTLFPTPTPMIQIFEVWAVVTAAAILVFWFVSKVTAHHPEKAEEV